MVSDATFSEDTNYLWQFITNVKATVILMTATINWIKEMIEAEGFKIIDKTDECINIRPNNIKVISHKKALDILSHATSNNKMIYMMPYGERIEREDFTYKTLIKDNKLPNDVNILLTTTKLREGINIKDKRIKMCIIGCHSSVDIRQFAGRVRTGIETLYVVDDKKQHTNNIKEFELEVSKKLIEKFDEVLFQYLNRGFGERKLAARVEECKNYYEMMECKFDLIKFNRYNNKFELYNQRIIACEKEKQDLDCFNNNTWLYLVNIFGKGINITLNDRHSYNEGIKDKCRLFLYDYIGKPLSTEDIDLVLEELTKIGLRNTKKQVYRSLGAALTCLGYKLDWEGNKHRGSKIIKPIESQGEMDII